MENKNLQEEFKSRVYRYTLRLVRFLSAISKNSVAREIINQLMRSGTSIGANYFEAYAASLKKDFSNFFSYSLKSANETKFWLAILRDSKLIPNQQNYKTEIDWLIVETKELANIFTSSIITMREKKGK